jgi:hypothetical protein
MINNLQTPETDIQTFRRLRKAIGLMGMSLPFVLVLLSLIPFFKTNVQQSISYYYYTNLREIFVGVLCAVSLFLIRYRGFYNPVFWKNDNKMTNLAGIMALGVALVPTNPVDCSEKIYTLIPVCAKFIGCFHYFFAASFFIILAIISIVIFTIGQNHNPGLKPRLLNENNIYRICGYVIILCVILIPICDVLHLLRSSTLILEALALIAFGISWLIKGRVFGDKGKVGVVLYRESNQ